jgi:hypothetical protein
VPCSTRGHGHRAPVDGSSAGSTDATRPVGGGDRRATQRATSAGHGRSRSVPVSSSTSVTVAATVVRSTQTWPTRGPRTASAVARSTSSSAQPVRPHSATAAWTSAGCRTPASLNGRSRSGASMASARRTGRGRRRVTRPEGPGCGRLGRGGSARRQRLGLVARRSDPAGQASRTRPPEVEQPQRLHLRSPAHARPPSSRSLVATISSAGGCQANTPHGCPSTTGVSGPTMPRRNR